MPSMNHDVNDSFFSFSNYNASAYSRLYLKRDRTIHYLNRGKRIVGSFLSMQSCSTYNRKTRKDNPKSRIRWSFRSETNMHLHIDELRKEGRRSVWAVWVQCNQPESIISVPNEECCVHYISSRMYKVYRNAREDISIVIRVITRERNWREADIPFRVE